jgi:hypothetical protein
MKRQVSAFSLGAALTAFSISDVSAEERCKVSGVVPASNTTYTQQHVLDAGDMPGHQVRIFELHRTYPADTKPNCEGLKRTETWIRAFSDYIDRNGRVSGYQVTTLENGDKIFSEFSGTSQTVVSPDGSKKSTNSGVARYTGGTGKYQAVRGLERESGVFDLDQKISQVQFEAEYWLEK